VERPRTTRLGHGPRLPHRMLILGRRHLEAGLGDHVAHDNQDRPHRALGHQTPRRRARPPPMSDPESAQLRRRATVFGLIHEQQFVA
jgi:hypothetical protein